MDTIFIVDDNDINLVATADALSGLYNVFTVPSAEVMFELLEDVRPDLILLDIAMPEMNGFEAMDILKGNENYAEIPVIFLTGKNDPATEAKCFDVGAVDFISKPYANQVLLNRIKMHLNQEEIIKERTEKLKRLQFGIVSVLANMVESRDKMTGGHMDRTAKCIEVLIKAMYERGVYADEISTWNLETVISSVRLHDIGKIAITDLLLNKPGRLTDEEYALMKDHAAFGEQIIDSMILESGDGYFLHSAKQFAAYHHERWDGSGYPRGLRGEDIPLLGRIMAVIDVYDALVSARPYKLPFAHKDAVAIISESSGTHFDPKIVDVFVEVCDKFDEIEKEIMATQEGQH
jgi:putative two-component system response regulator